MLANILANPLIELACLLIGFLKPGGALVLSRILEKEIERVAATYSKLQLIDTSVDDG